MRSGWFAILAASLAGTVSGAEPKAVSVHPFTGRPGSSFLATVRGNALARTQAIFAENVPFTVAVEGVEVEPPGASSGRNKMPFDLVRVRVDVAGGAKPGRYAFRIVTPEGVSNALTLHVVDQEILAEPPGEHETPDAAVALERIPVVVNGRIARRGETDYFLFDAKAGQTLTFEAISGLPSIAAPGSNANGFDPSLSVYEASGSWFDAKRLKRIAWNDEPLWVIGLITDAYLVHKFERAGRYYLRLAAFSGQGGPDYGYQLKILSGEFPRDEARESKAWEERGFSRRLSASRLNELAERGGSKQDRSPIETYRASAELVTFKLPGTVEGSLAQPGESQRARFHIEGSQDIAIEVETPDSAPPVFNPIVRLLDASGGEVATNISAGRGACTGAMFKSLAAKTIVPLRDAGDYTIEIRDTTADLAGPGFRYRVQVRPQVPHVGQIRIDDDHINLPRGEAKTLRVNFDREEDYRGAIAVTVEGLPAGVEALAGADFDPDKDPPLSPGKRERYAGRAERTVVVIHAAADAPATAIPQIAKILVRPVVGGKPGAVIATRQIPVMVLEKP
jgi:hypothetical protein